MTTQLPSGHPEAERPADRAQSAFLVLRTAIVEAALPPGTKLPEDALGTHFGVSRTLIRAALARLTAEGLVETGRARSATVASPSIDEARAVFEVRRCLEREAVRLVAGRWTPAMARRLRAHTQAESEAAAAQEFRVSGRLAAEFHTLLGELSGNPLLQRYLTEVVYRCALILAVHGRDHDQQRSLGEHLGLIDLLAAGDADGAERVVAEHVLAVEERALSRRPVPGPIDLTTVLAQY